MGAKVQFPGQFLRHAASDALIEPLVEPDSEPGVRWRPLVSTEMLIVLASLYFALFCNGRFWNVLVVGRAWASVSTWVFAGAMLVVLVGIHCLLLALVVTRWNARLVLVVTLIVTALVRYYMERYTVFFDAGMVRNVLHTDWHEARELITVDMLLQVLLYGWLPALAVLVVRLKRRTPLQAFIARLEFMLFVSFLVAAAVVLVFQDLSALMRNQKEARYLITPANAVVSLLRVAVADTRAAQIGPRKPVAADARLGQGWANRRKPVLLVIVVGETARAASWGLNGYSRQTTPRLAARAVINFPQVISCGTNTEVSVPCMFSPFGRYNYDERAIRSHESLLHVLSSIGFRVLWRDNQSGCKGVCDGLEEQRMAAGECDKARCLDVVLLQGLEAEVAKSDAPTVVVLHQLGNHGPAYFLRHPAAYRRFVPTCDTSDLGKCTREEIVNSYDNALLYTDTFLDQAISRLQALDTHDTALLYVSDHGESLGEKGIYLHGFPYAIAPHEQTQVPMVMWLAGGFARSFGLDPACLREAATRPVSHDYLFHSVLGMLDVDSRARERNLDFTAGCRAGTRTAALTTETMNERSSR